MTRNNSRLLLALMLAASLVGTGCVTCPRTRPAAGDTAVFAGVEFVWCPPGAFLMGAGKGYQDPFEASAPQHEVIFKRGFWISRYEVTQAQWQEVMHENPSLFQPAVRGGADTDKRPVENVTWNDVQRFLAALNQRHPERKFRLPTEAEWEYACRAGSATPFYWGDDPGGTEIAGYAWYVNNSGAETQTHDVGAKLPNAWGLYDMAGNVWEWVEDPYHPDYNGAPADGSAWDSPTASVRSVRGGSCFSQPALCTSSGRWYAEPGFRLHHLGFRLIKE